MTLGFDKPFMSCPSTPAARETARDPAVAEIPARRFREWVDIFEKARPSPLRDSIRQAVNQTPAVKEHRND